MSIRSHANALLAHYWAGKSLPVDPIAIAIARGIDVRPFAPGDAGTASGWFHFDGDMPTIRYNSTESENRQRFTIAHELGHFELAHGSRKRDSAAEFNMYNFDPIEVEANRFAAELLMPEAAVRHYVQHGNISISELARTFAVSEVAMKYRLKNLGILR